MSTVIQLREFDTVPVPSDLLMTGGQLDVNPAIVKQDLFAVRFGASELQIQARGFVGLIPINDRLTLEVAPRFPASNLTRLVEVSGVPPKALADVMRTYRRARTMFPSLIGLYAEALLQSVTEVTTSGLLREYEWREEVSSNPRGRILVGKSIQATIARGVHNKLAFGWYQRTTDIAANRCLLYAAHRLAQYNRRAGKDGRTGEFRRVARQLNRCIQLLPGVTLDASANFLRDPLVTGRVALPSLRRYYRPAIDLALAIIGGEAVDIESQEGNVRLPSLLLEMSRIFEAYLRNVLGQVCVDEGWDARVLNGNLGAPTGAAKPNLLDDGVAIKATPDIVLATGPVRSPTYRGVIEVKYKPAKNQTPDRADLDQTLAYGVSYRAESVVVVQPRLPQQVAGWRHLGTLQGMNVAIYLFDLGAEDLAAQELQFAHAVRSTMLPGV